MGDSTLKNIGVTGVTRVRSFYLSSKFKFQTMLQPDL